MNRLLERYNTNIFPSHCDGVRRWFLSFDMPSYLGCRVLGHRVHVVDLGRGTKYTECDRCFRRPDGFTRRSSSHVEVSGRYTHRFSIQLTVGNAGSETPIDGHLIIPKFRGFYFGTDIIGHRFANRKSNRRRNAGTKNEYTTEVYGLDIDKHSVTWQIGAAKDSWSKGTPKWKYGGWNFYDTIFGKVEYHSEVMDRQEVTLALPDENYAVVLTVEEQVWSRKRRPSKIEHTVSIRALNPTSIPTGHTTMGDWDGLVEFSVPYDNVDGNWITMAKMAAVEKVLQERERYSGSRNWMPPLDAY